MTTDRRRLDVQLVRAGIVETREQAQIAISAKQVLVNGSIALKAAQQVRTSDAIRLLETRRFVSRAGFKLERALDEFSVEVRGLRCLDVGLSTGGFSQCLLRNGAFGVVGVDVGTSQVHEKIATDPRMLVVEQTDIRDFARSCDTSFELIVCDVSFISLCSIAAALKSLLLLPKGLLLVLIKPQFELDKASVSRGKGVVRSVELWRKAIFRVVEGLNGQSLVLTQIAPARPKGATGNQEFVALFKYSSRFTLEEVDATLLIERALESALLVD